MELTQRQPFGAEALENCAAALASGSLSSVNGPFTARLEEGFASFYGAAHAVAASSGTAALHTAVASLRLEPGTEVVVAPITDAGSVVPLLYEGLIPTFCDVDEHLAMTVEGVEAALTERTGAIMLVHLFGGVSDAAALRRFADERGLFLIEDCSQAHATQLGARPVGTFGHLGAFSMQQSKHMTSGDGGVVITDDDELAGRMRLFRDKGWDRSSPHARAYPHLGLNYRITELQSAVALPQLATLPAVVARRRAIAARLDEAVAQAPGAEVWTPPPGGPASYWCYPFYVAPERRDAVAAALREAGVPVTGGYIGAPIFECLAATHEQRTFGSSGHPFPLAGEGFSYADVAVPHARAALDRVVVVWIHEHLTDADTDAIAAAITEACNRGAA
ncbi:DegT/DnrJ/EryC1/StrS family aminotransferase [Propioniciclava soli]|uniref:DegT/DnrJ/EryC1/StrS family aminotransferase n=1 Tax=Propioniciclava soli TaxID=2775081 RepID=A0ABZ3CE44_9ACTN